MSGPWLPLGSALAAFHDFGEDVAVTVRTDVGPTEIIRPSFFFRDEDAFEDWESTYDTVILLMNGSMIAETLSGLDRLLAVVATVLATGGALVLDSTDLRGVMNDSTDGPEESPEDGLEDDDRYIGELHYQLSVGDHMGEVFPQLLVDPDTLDARARRAGWNIDVLWSGPGGRYLARLQRPIGSVTDDAARPDSPFAEALA